MELDLAERFAEAFGEFELGLRPFGTPGRRCGIEDLNVEMEPPEQVKEEIPLAGMVELDGDRAHKRDVFMKNMGQK